MKNLRLNIESLQSLENDISLAQLELEILLRNLKNQVGKKELIIKRIELLKGLIEKTSPNSTEYNSLQYRLYTAEDRLEYYKAMEQKMEAIKFLMPWLKNFGEYKVESTKYKVESIKLKVERG